MPLLLHISQDAKRAARGLPPRAEKITEAAPKPSRPSKRGRTKPKAPPVDLAESKEATDA